MNPFLSLHFILLSLSLQIINIFFFFILYPDEYLCSIQIDLEKEKKSEIIQLVYEVQMI